MQRTSRHVIAWGLLFSLLLTSQVGAASPATAMASKYEYYYQGFQAGEYWVTVTKMNGIAVPNGLGIFNKDTGGNLNIVSETMGYAMILAALYDDQDTFDKLSATVQVGIRSGLTPTNIETKLLPWTWTQSSTAGTFALKSGASLWLANKAHTRQHVDLQTNGDQLYSSHSHQRFCFFRLEYSK